MTTLITAAKETSYYTMEPLLAETLDLIPDLQLMGVCLIKLSLSRLHNTLDFVSD